MKLSGYAKKLGVTYRTAWNHFKAGKIEGAFQLPTGTVIVPEDAIDKLMKNAPSVSAIEEDKVPQNFI